MAGIVDEAAVFPPSGFEQAGAATQDEMLRAFAVRMKEYVQQNTERLAGAQAELAGVLRTLNPGPNTLPYLALLDIAVQLAHDHVDPCLGQGLAGWISAFLDRFDPIHVRYWGDAFRRVVDKVSEGTLVAPPDAVPLVVKAILRLDPLNTILTSMHCDVAKLAFTSNNHSDVLPLLQLPAVLMPMAAPVQPNQCLCGDDVSARSFVLAGTFSRPLRAAMVGEFYLVAGHILAGTHTLWDEAEKSYLRSIYYYHYTRDLTENRTVAYRHWLLCCVLNPLDRAKLPQFPAYIPNGVESSLQKSCNPYVNLVRACLQPNTAETIKTLIQEHADVWAADQTATLVDMVARSYQRRFILRMAKVYASVPVATVRAKTQCAVAGTTLSSDDEVLDILKDMIACGEVDATLPSVNGTTYLRFARQDTPAYEQAVMDRMLARGAMLARNRQLQHLVELDLRAHDIVASAELSSMSAAATASAAGMKGAARVEARAETSEEDLMV